MSHRVRRPFAAIAILLLALSSGCNDFSPDSSAPVTQVDSPAPQAAAAPKGSEPAPAGSLAIVDELLQPIKQVTSIVLYDVTKPLSFLLPRSQYISAARGGSVSNGGFTLTIPAGALKNDTQVSLRPSSLLQCQVEVLPSGLTFKPGTAATLSFDYNKTNAVGATTLTCVWFDPAKNVWVSVAGGANDSSARKFNVPLSHFSYYALAK